jgi:hypothetical protein
MIVQRFIVALFQLKSSSAPTPIATQPLEPILVLPNMVTEQRIGSRRPRPADMEVDDTETDKAKIAEHPRAGVDKVRIIEHPGAGQKIRKQETQIRELEDRVSAIYL